MRPAEAEDRLRAAADALALGALAPEDGDLRERLGTLRRLIDQGQALTAARLEMYYPSSAAYTAAGARPVQAAMTRFVAEA